MQTLTKAIMASTIHRVTLTEGVIDKLAGAISKGNLERIAYLYFSINFDEAKNINHSVADAVSFNREVIQRWRNKCKEHDEVEVRSQYFRISLNVLNAIILLLLRHLYIL